MAITAGELAIEIEINQREVSRKLDGINRSVARMSTNVNRNISSSFGRLTTTFDRIGTRMSLSMRRSFDRIGRHARRAALIISGAFALIVSSSIKAAANAVETENLFTTSMASMSEAAEKWTKKTSQGLGTLELDTKKYLATLNVMIKSIGISTDESFKMSKALTTLTFDMASYFNLSFDESFQKIQSGMAGQSRPLKNLGFLLSETIIKQHAWLVGIAEVGKELTELEKTQARYSKLMQLTGFLMGDMARTIESPANKFRVLQSSIQKLQISIGKGLLPAWKEFLTHIQGFVDKYGNKLTKWFKDIGDEVNDFLSDPKRIETFNEALKKTVDVLKEIGENIVTIGKVTSFTIGLFTKFGGEVKKSSNGGEVKKPSNIKSKLIAGGIGAIIGGKIAGPTGALTGAAIGVAAKSTLKQNLVVGGATAGVMAILYKAGLLSKAGATIAGAGGATTGAIPAITGFAGAGTAAGAGTGAAGAATLSIPAIAAIVAAVIGTAFVGKKIWDIGVVIGKKSDFSKVNERLAEQKRQIAAGTFIPKSEKNRIEREKRAAIVAKHTEIAEKEKNRLAGFEAIRIKNQKAQERVIKAFELKRESEKILSEKNTMLRSLSSRTNMDRTLKLITGQGAISHFQSGGPGGLRKQFRDKTFIDMLEELKKINATIEKNNKEIKTYQ